MLTAVRSAYRSLAFEKVSPEDFCAGFPHRSEMRKILRDYSGFDMNLSDTFIEWLDPPIRVRSFCHNE